MQIRSNHFLSQFKRKMLNFSDKEHTFQLCSSKETPYPICIIESALCIFSLHDQLNQKYVGTAYLACEEKICSKFISEFTDFLRIMDADFFASWMLGCLSPPCRSQCGRLAAALSGLLRLSHSVSLTAALPLSRCVSPQLSFCAAALST